MTIDRCEPDLKGHQSDFFIWTICGFNNRCHMGSKSITTGLLLGGKCRAGLDSRMEDFLNILLQKKLIPDDIIIQRQRF